MKPRELATGLFDVLATGDAELARRIVAPDNVNREAVNSPNACRLPGPAGTLASGAWMRYAFEGLRFPVLGVAEAPNQVWVRLRMQGKHVRPFVKFNEAGSVDQVVPPTGQEIDFEQVHILDLRSGQVVRHEALRDDITMLGQLGVFPPSPAFLPKMLLWKLSGKASRAANEVSMLAEKASRQAVFVA